MKIHETGFRNLVVIENKFYSDNRGGFTESFNEASFRLHTGQNITFVQDNLSVSVKNVVRGLHYQLPPKGQAKLVMVHRGAAWDVAVDLRVSEPTFGKWFSVELREGDNKQLFIPEGFAHGFIALEENTLFAYKCSNYYSPEHERCILWNDPALCISWPTENPIMSAKDCSGISFKDYGSDFI